MSSGKCQDADRSQWEQCLSDDLQSLPTAASLSDAIGFLRPFRETAQRLLSADPRTPPISPDIRTQVLQHSSMTTEHPLLGSQLTLHQEPHTERYREMPHQQSDQINAGLLRQIHMRGLCAGLSIAGYYWVLLLQGQSEYRQMPVAHLF